MGRTCESLNTVTSAQDQTWSCEAAMLPTILPCKASLHLPQGPSYLTGESCEPFAIAS